MRELAIHKVNGLNEAIKIEVLDEPGPGSACHHYELTLPEWTREPGGGNAVGIWNIQFQNGPIAEVGVNGISNEALLAIVEDRLAGFQSGPYACDENETAWDYVKAAIRFLQKRTLDRIARGVEGTSEQ